MILGLGVVGNQKKAPPGPAPHPGEAGTVTQPCEAAYLGLSKLEGPKVPKIRVYVTPTSLTKMKTVYKRFGLGVKVSPLLLNQSELDARAFTSLMGINPTMDQPQLYIKIVLVCLCCF